MAGKNVSKSGSKESSKSTDRALFVGYVNITLTEKDKFDYDGWVNDDDIVMDDLLSSLDLGYQYSLKYDIESACFLCSVSQWRVNRPDAGLIYSARSDHPFNAQRKAIYVAARKLAFNLANGYVNKANKDAF